MRFLMGAAAYAVIMFGVLRTLKFANRKPTPKRTLVSDQQWEAFIAAHKELEEMK
jgi:hypothetical protein